MKRKRRGRSRAELPESLASDRSSPPNSERDATKTTGAVETEERQKTSRPERRRKKRIDRKAAKHRGKGTAAPPPVPVDFLESLLPQHRKLIIGSAISAAVAAARGYRSITTKADLQTMGFGEAQRRIPTLLIPIWSVNGAITLYQSRPDMPRIIDGKAIKYETPRGARMELDVPPAVRVWIADPSRPLFITEGVRKADAAATKELCCIALLGVWNFRGKNEFGGMTALAAWESIAIENRQVYIVFDSDVMTKPAVQMALARLKAFLESRGGHVLLVYLPAGEGGGKVGLDDFFNAGHGVDDLLALATPELRRPVSDEPEPREISYRHTPAGMVHLRSTQQGVVEVPLTNFSAKIVGNIARDDGAEVRREFDIVATLHGKETRFSVPAAQFPTMCWVAERLGAGAVVYAGIGTRDHTRVAIQILSDEPAERILYTHTGWCRIGGDWLYLHAGGAIGPNGPIGPENGVGVVELRGPLGLVDLQWPLSPEALRAAVRASLSVLDVASETITAPILGAAYRAVLEEVIPADESVHLVGDTGLFKTELAALGQQHFGAGFDRLHLPASWFSSANSLERLVFDAKDAIVTIDDFAPTGTPTDVARLHATAERVMRGIGNRSSRGRMAATGQRRPDYPPRGYVVSTGEDVPRGRSLRSRIVIVDVAPGDVDLKKLSGAQLAGREGLYAAAMAGFLHWLAPRIEELRRSFPARLAALRDDAVATSVHRRTPGAVASLAAAWELFLEFTAEIGAVSPADKKVLWKRVWDGLCNTASAQSDHHAGEDPSSKFLSLLTSALVSSRAHLAGENSGPPLNSEHCGWRERILRIGEDGVSDTAWEPRGDRVGWIIGEDVFLDPETAYATAQRLARDQNDSLPVTQRTLWKRLAERKLLLTTDGRRGKNITRVTIGGIRHDVLHLPAECLLPPSRKVSGPIGPMGPYQGNGEEEDIGGGVEEGTI